VLEKERYSAKANILSGDVTEKNQEKLQLWQLHQFLRKQSADNIILEIRGLSLEEALEEVVAMGSDELVSELLNQHPEVLKEKYAANIIAEYRSDEVCMHMIEKHPEVLKEKYVAWTIAEYRSDKVSMYMIENYPWVLEEGYVAWGIAKHISDEVCMYMLEKHPEVLKYEDVAEAVAEYRSDEVCMHMLEKHPEVLKYEYVGRVIAEYRSDEVCMHMIEKYPEVLKYEDVAKVIAEYRSDEVCMHMIEKRPEVLKEKDVAWTIAEYRSDKVSMYMIENYPWVLEEKGAARVIARYRSDEVCMHMIEKHPEVLKGLGVGRAIAMHRSDKVSMDIIEKHPELLGMERSIYDLALGLALANKSKVLTHILLVLGEIKPNDVELTTSQFSAMLGELNAYNKERLMKRIFLDRAAISYRKELNSMSLPYRALLDMLNVSAESAERLAKELSKAEGNVRKALPLRGLAYALAHMNGGEMLNPFIKNSRSVMNAITIFPTVYELRHTNIIGDSEFQQILNSKDKEAELFKQLVSRVESTFNVKPKSEDAIKAMSDYIFLDDLFGLYAKYHRDNEQAEMVLINAVKHYFEGGIKSFKEFKFGGHELASKQLRGVPPSKLMNLDKLAVTYTSKRSIPYDSVKNDIDNFLNHKDKLLMILDEIEKNANNELSEIAKSAKSKELASLLESKDLDGLTSHAFDSDDEKVKAKGIAQIKLLKARESLDFINNIVDELQKMSGKSKEEQDIIMEEIAKKVAEWVDKKGLEPSKMLRNYISKINKQQTDKGEQELEISANALDNAISIVEVLLKYSKIIGDTTVTAQITFDPSKILTFGRYGSSGAGNCQNSKGKVTYNQSLMSMVGDANQFMIMFQKIDDTRPLGFMQVHLLKSEEKGMIFFMEKPYTNEPDKSTVMKEAAGVLAQKIKNETGFDCFTYGEAGDKIEELEVEVPRSYVSRYIDFARALEGPESFQYKINAKCLTSSPLFNLRR